MQQSSVHQCDVSFYFRHKAQTIKGLESFSQAFRNIHAKYHGSQCRGVTDGEVKSIAIGAFFWHNVHRSGVRSVFAYTSQTVAGPKS